MMPRPNLTKAKDFAKMLFFLGLLSTTEIESPIIIFLIKNLFKIVSKFKLFINKI